MILEKSLLYDFGPPGRNMDAYVSPTSKGNIGRLGDCPGDFVPPDCPNWQEHGAEYFEPEIYSFYLASPTPADFLWYPLSVLLKDELVNTVKKRLFTGIEFRPVNLFRKPNCTEALPGYSEMRISGRAPVDLGRSGVELEYKCPTCGFAEYSLWSTSRGLHFECDYESLPDLFKLEPLITGVIIVKPSFAEFVVELGLRPVMLVPFEHIRPFEWEHPMEK